ncbi:MAG: isoaspartyl peptidase/L-asparaginase [Bacteroidetes bacterium]|nr:MAG: isoaspartyl peptidase/L-asparaginase [Bacteroidota bacterium]
MRFFYFLITLLLTMAATLIWQDKPEYVFAIHGGAGAMSRDKMTPELEAQYRAGLEEALSAGETVLKSGGSAEDAVIAAITLLEDNPLFNAGKGAVLTNAGTAELDASIMSGRTGLAGAIAGVKTIRNPILAARLVMDSSEHVMLTGKGAETFASSHGLKTVKNSYFITPQRQEQLRKVKEEEKASGKHADAGQYDPSGKKFGTVGAVALDRNGNLAAGTSTGGMTNKRYGRVGDAPIIGAGTYANNNTCAVSCTGHGEYFIRNVVAYDLAAMLEYTGKTLEDAANQIIFKKLKTIGGEGGLIAVDKQGNVAMPFNSEGMYRGYLNSKGERMVAIYKD